MSYQVLARKWRPQVFEDVVGQGHITRTLQNAIETNRLAHAFLFSGPRGVGKTTTARILAKALNCKEGPTPRPCGTCDSCLETAAGTSVDVIEVDGASNRGIEHIRELRETVKYAPAGGKYKVYVIDEVHMLTNEAFNALLKTLEEPPPHVLFIFATTEPQKIPATIHSRCQRYSFKRISLQETADKLREIASKEGITISDPGLAMIARAAEGSMRDSQSLLDQAVSYSGMTIRDEDLQNILGTVSRQELVLFTDRLLERNADGLLRQIDDLLERGQDSRLFLAGVVEHLRDLMVTLTTQDPNRIIELPAADLEVIRNQAAKTGVDRLLFLFDSLSRTLDELKRSPHQRFTFEIGVVKACSAVELRPLGEVLERMKDLEARLSFEGTASPGAGAVHERPSGYAPGKRAAAAAPAPEKEEAGTAAALWSKVISSLKQKRPGLATALQGSAILERTDQGMVIGIRGTAFQLEQAEKKENREIIEQGLATIMGRSLPVSYRLLSGERKHASAPGMIKPEVKQPDPLVQEAMDIFKGQILDAGTEDTNPSGR